jgi:ABC-type glycerol-3-phosphate transport system substrate-binding protein
MGNRKLLIVLVLIVVFFGAIQSLWAGGQAGAEQKKLTFLSWNIAYYEKGVNGWFSDMQAAHPEVQLEWIDKKGTEWATYFQTQLAGGDVPDVLEIQGTLWVEYADMGAIMNLQPYLDKDPTYANGFNPDLLDQMKLGMDNYMIPFHMTPSHLLINKVMFEDAGLKEPPKTFAELADYSRKMTKGENEGFLTLNFDWFYWPLFKVNGVDILTPDNKKAAFNTPAAARTLEILRNLTAEGAISKISWTGRWNEPNSAFGAGNIGMYNSVGLSLPTIRAAGSPLNSEKTLDSAPFPGEWSYANYHGVAITSSTKYPDMAWELTKIICSDKWGEDRIRVLMLLCGRKNVDQPLVYENTEFINEDPIRAKILQTELEVTDHFTGVLKIPENERIKQAVYTQIQRAVLGEVDPETALAAAERDVNKILSE